MGDIIEKLFTLFCPTWPTFVCEIILDRVCENLKKCLAGAIYEQEKEET